MNILFKVVLFGISVISIQAITLKELINKTLQNNQNLKANSFIQKVKQKNFESVKNIYNPNLIVGASYNRLDLDVRNTQVVNTTTAFAKVSVNLYDGGKNKALKKQKLYEYTAQKYQNITDTKQTILNLVNLYFNLKTIEENIKVYQEKSKALKAQYDRMKVKYDVKMATIDEVLKFKSEYDLNLYTIEEFKYQKEELLQNIELLSGVKIDKIDTQILPNLNVEYTQTSDIQALKNSLKANEENVNIVKSIKKPQLKLEDSLNVYKYSDYNEKLLKDLPDEQNQFNITLSYNLFDTSSKAKIESAKLLKLATAHKLAFTKNRSKMDFELAKRKLQTQQLKVKSLKSAVEMANSVYEAIKNKYENGVVDNIAYLDALSKKIYNLGLYKKALNDLEIAKVDLYFKSGVDYKKVLKEWK